MLRLDFAIGAKDDSREIIWGRCWRFGDCSAPLVRSIEMKKNNRKLSLCGETLGRLDGVVLPFARGGAPFEENTRVTNETGGAPIPTQDVFCPAC